MPTESLKKLLDRDLQKVRAAPMIQVACPLLRETVNYGTNVFSRCEISRHNTNVKDIHDEGHIVILLLFRHILEMIDAMEVAMSNSVVDPALIQLRSAFEAYLQLEWIMKDDTLQRVYVYLVYDIRDRIKIYRALDLSSKPGKQIQAKIRKDKWASSISIPEVKDLDERISNLTTLLMQKHLIEIDACYNPREPWYAAFGGPKNLEQLAEKLEHPYWYEVLYRESSNIAHASYLTRNFRKGDIDVLRNATDLVNITEMAIALGVWASHCMLNFYRPGELTSFWTWHEREIVAGSARLANF
jgi:Family of unknown function (DUF5677)